MSCAHSASKHSVLHLALLLASAPFIWALQALNALNRLRKCLTPTQMASQPARNYLPLSPYPMTNQGPFLPLLGPSGDDFDPEHDPWSRSLDDKRVIEACRQHLSRCLPLDPSRYDHP